MERLPKSAFELWERTNRNQSQFLQTETRVGLTLAGLALSDHSKGRHAAAARLIAEAKKAYEAILKYSARTRMGERDRALLNCRVSQLRRTIEEFE